MYLLNSHGYFNRAVYHIIINYCHFLPNYKSRLVMKVTLNMGGTIVWPGGSFQMKRGKAENQTSEIHQDMSR